MQTKYEVTLRGYIELRAQVETDIRALERIPSALRSQPQKKELSLLRKELKRLQQRIDDHPEQPRQLSFDDCAAFELNVALGKSPRWR